MKGIQALGVVLFAFSVASAGDGLAMFRVRRGFLGRHP
jgi:hypothetical protein